MKNNCLLCAMFFAFVVASMAYADVPAIQWNVLPERPVAVGGQYAGVSGGALLAGGGAHFPTPLFEGGSKVWVDSVFALKRMLLCGSRRGNFPGRWRTADRSATRRD